MNNTEHLPAPTAQSATAENAAEKNTAGRPNGAFKLSPKLALVLGILVVLGLVVGAVPRWLEHRRAVSVQNALEVPVVAVVSPTPKKDGAGLDLPAEIRPWREASIYARANGYLKDWLVDIGAHVQAGQLLAEIDAPDLDQQLDQAKAQLVLAQANLHLAEITDNRWQSLLKTASVSDQEAAEKAAAHEIAAASVAADQANVRRLGELVAFEKVVAPFDGVITVRDTDNGDLIVAGSGGRELFHIAQTDKLRVYVRVPETFASAVASGQTAKLTTPAVPGRQFTATVTTSSEAISDASRTLLVELELDNSQHQLLPYSFGQLTLVQADHDPVLTLPSNTLLFRAQGLQVAVVRPDNTVELRSIQVGRDLGQNIEILGGVTAADRVVMNPPDSLVNGAQVHVQAPPENTASK